MPNKMLIDATHPEETRVVVLRGHRVEEFDFESANRKQLRGNIYLAKVTRVEPSLQAAFIDYGGNRHGFLAFGEIHPDYYQIPVADRQALIAEDERAQRAAEAEAERRAGRRQSASGRSSRRMRDEIKSEPVESAVEHEPEIFAMTAASEQPTPEAGLPEPEATDTSSAVASAEQPAEHADDAPPTAAEEPVEPAGYDRENAAPPLPAAEHASPPVESNDLHADDGGSAEPLDDAASAEREAENAELIEQGNITEVNGNGGEHEEEVIESVGGADAMEEVPERMPRLRRQYKIQEVIKRRQVMLVQVVKEERGTKGAALTTYLSLAGRYSVLMPNTARGGGISRKITSAEDRRRLKEIAQDLEVPEGMGVILRTAGASRTKTEVKRDFEYLLRLWETVRDLTLKSTAPTLVYEEGSLVKRSIRDLYNKDIDEILVAGEEAYKEAKLFMRMLMPSHAKNVKLYRDPLPIFNRYGIESQLDAMFTPVMQLRSGGYIVLNQAEALVAIDVNSGRATREHHIEDTALKTNLEAAEEIARQLRLRDLAGLIVIDFIDMDEKRNNRAVERRLKECLRHDRARIQVGHISHFGLLEMSRQRIRSSVLESSTERCPHCGGTGHVRSVSSVALQLLRALEEMLLKGATHNLTVRTRSTIALYLLNQKRAHLRSLEERFRIAIMVSADETVGGQTSFLIEKGEQVHSLEQARALAQQTPTAAPVEEEDEEEERKRSRTTPKQPRSRRRARRRRRRPRASRRSRGKAASAVDGDAGGAAAKPVTPTSRRRVMPRRVSRRRSPMSIPHRASTTTPTAARRSKPATAPPSPTQRRTRHTESGSDDGAADAAAAGATGAAARASGSLRPATAALSSRSRYRRRSIRKATRSPSARRSRYAFRSSKRATIRPPTSRRRHTSFHPPRNRRLPSRTSQHRRRDLIRSPGSTRSPRSASRRAAARRCASPRPAASRSEAPQPAPELVPPAAATEPVVTSPAESESSDRPRRSGWWSKRVLGRG